MKKKILLSFLSALFLMLIILFWVFSRDNVNDLVDFYEKSPIKSFIFLAGLMGGLGLILYSLEIFNPSYYPLNFINFLRKIKLIKHPNKNDDDSSRFLSLMCFSAFLSFSLFIIILSFNTLLNLSKEILIIWFLVFTLGMSIVIKEWKLISRHEIRKRKKKIDKHKKKEGK